MPMDMQVVASAANESLTLVERLVRHVRKPSPVKAEVYYEAKQPDLTCIKGEVRIHLSDPNLDFARIRDLSLRARVATPSGDDYASGNYATLRRAGFSRMITTARLGDEDGPLLSSPSKQELVLLRGETLRVPFSVDLRLVMRGLYPPTSDAQDIPKERLVRDAYTRLFLDPFVSVHAGATVTTPAGTTHHYRATNSNCVPMSQFTLSGAGPTPTAGVRVVDQALRLIKKGPGIGGLYGVTTYIPPQTAEPSVAMLDSVFADEIVRLSEQLTDTYRDLYLADAQEESWVCEQVKWIHAVHEAIRDRAEIHGVEHRKLPFTLWDTVTIERDGFKVIVDGLVGSDRVEEGRPPKVTGLSLLMRSNDALLDKQHTASVDGWERIGRWANGYPELSIPLCTTRASSTNREQILGRFYDSMARVESDCESVLGAEQDPAMACPCEDSAIDYYTFAPPPITDYADCQGATSTESKSIRQGPAP